MLSYVFPAVFEPEAEGGFSIYFPDLRGCYSQGDDIADGIAMASDALALRLYCLEKDGKDIPVPSSIDSIPVGNGSFVTYISANTLEYQMRNSSKAVKKTLSIPEWLNERAVAAGVNFSQTLQDALKAQLHLV